VIGLEPLKVESEMRLPNPGRLLLAVVGVGIGVATGLVVPPIGGVVAAAALVVLEEVI
jgi:hypothetical protein